MYSETKFQLHPDKNMQAFPTDSHCNNRKRLATSCIYTWSCQKWV